MATFSSPSSSPPPGPSRRKLRSCARRCERVCCTLATYFPLTFVYSLTTWAVWVEGSIGFAETGAKNVTQPIKASSVLGITLYLLLNSSYTVAVFTDPGSPLKSHDSRKQGKYSVLPTSEPRNDLGDLQTITVSSRGGARFCKKCQSSKPDRTHHCSTCNRCVLKMDHHCPWLATCLGLHNYKAFILFLIYTSLFCWVCLFSSGWWMFTSLFPDNQSLDEYSPINIIMLSVISGIIGLVLTGFTAWHLYLCVRGQTTIECLEKTRYLSGVRSRVERNRQEHQSHSRNASEGGVVDTLQRAGEQILEFHANAVPGASRYEEGEEHTSPAPSYRSSAMTASTVAQTAQPPVQSETPAQRSLRLSYSTLESQRERVRYDEYLDDKESEKLPNAFDLGWKRNLVHLFGPSPLLWALPVCNTTGDGWRWEVSQTWLRANEEAAKRRAERMQREVDHMSRGSETSAGAGTGLRGGGYEHDREQAGDYRYDYDYNVDNSHPTSHQHSDQLFRGNSAMSMQTLSQARPPAALTPAETRRPRQRRDFDRAEDGSVETFIVSSDDDDDGGYDVEGEDRKSHARTAERRKHRIGRSPYR